MPRVYLFTILLSVIIGFIIRDSFFIRPPIDFATAPYRFGFILLCLSVIYINEKTAMFENLIKKRHRQAISLLTVVTVLLLFGMVLLS